MRRRQVRAPAHPEWPDVDASPKTDVPFYVEVMPRLQEAIDAMPASSHLTFLVTEQGNPCSAAGFGNWFRDRFREQALAHLLTR
jgi:hypothetical protein